MTSWPDILTKSKSKRAFTRPPQVIDTQNRYHVLTSVCVLLGNNQYLFIVVEHVSTGELQLWMNFGSSTAQTHFN